MEDNEFKAVIYVNPSIHNVNRIDQFAHIKCILGNYWDMSNILIVNCSHDFAVQKWLREEAGGKRGFPQIYVGDVRIGFYEDLLSANESGLLALMSEQNMSSSLRLSIVPENLDSDEDTEDETEEAEANIEIGDDFVQKHVVTSWFDAGSWLVGVAKGVLHFLDSPVPELTEVTDSKLIEPSSPDVKVQQNPSSEEIEANTTTAPVDPITTTTPTTAAALVPQDPVQETNSTPAPTSTSEVQPKEEDWVHFDLEFLRTNWLWRSQSRIFRFKKDSFERIEKPAGAVERVCASFPYSSVAKVEKLDDKNVIIRFKDGLLEDQHLFSESVESIQKLIDTVNGFTNAMCLGGC